MQASALYTAQHIARCEVRSTLQRETFMHKSMAAWPLHPFAFDSGALPHSPCFHTCGQAFEVNGGEQ